MNRLLLALQNYDRRSRLMQRHSVESLRALIFIDRYPGFDLDEPDWPALRALVAQVAALLAAVQARIPTPKPPAT